MRLNVEYIQEAMQKNNWTGSHLARKMGVSRMEVSSEYTDRREPGNLM